MYKITREQFLLRQPSFPETTPTDPYYYDLCNRLLKEALESGLTARIPDAIVGRAALCVIGYLQDVAADCGVWRAFINECRRMYGRTLPFFEIGEDYVDFELNREDVRFLIWYSFSMYYESLRLSYPKAPIYESLTSLWMDILTKEYDEAPIPEGYTRWRETEIDSPEDSASLLDLANWLFMHNYLMTPAFAQTLSEIVASVDKKEEDAELILREKLEEAMHQSPTGPLALYVGEWMTLMLSGKEHQEEKKDSGTAEPHKFYKGVTEATNGNEIVFFDTYDKLNQFFIDALGWAEGEEHLPAMKDARDFVILANRDKGMLVARNVARCIAAPDNPYYDQSYAQAHAMDLLTERGLCPPDLREYVSSHGWLPDAVFPGTEDHRLVAENEDFIARCYLQLYYRGD